MVGNIYINEKEKGTGTAQATFYHDVVTKGGLYRFITPRNEQERKQFESSSMERITVTVTFEKPTAKKPVTKLIKANKAKVTTLKKK